MRRAIKTATRAEREYQQRARKLYCVVCEFRIKHGMQPKQYCGAPQLHHRNVGDYHGAPQIGEHAVVALAGWHHDAIILPGWTSKRMLEVFGLSFGWNARDFREWTADVLPELSGRGTERWQAYQDTLLAARGVVA